MRYWSSLPHTQIEQTRAWLAGMIHASPEESCDFILELQGRVIGKAGCWRLPEIGFILHPDFWGHGLAREALAAIIPLVFRRFPIDAIIADADPRNEASIGLLQRMGFVETGRAQRTFQLGDAWCDSVYFALPRSAASAFPSRSGAAG